MQLTPPIKRPNHKPPSSPTTSNSSISVPFLDGPVFCEGSLSFPGHESFRKVLALINKSEFILCVFFYPIFEVASKFQFKRLFLCKKDFCNPRVSLSWYGFWRQLCVHNFDLLPQVHLFLTFPSKFDALLTEAQFNVFLLVSH